MENLKIKGKKNFDGKLYRRRTAYHEAGHAVFAVIRYRKIVFARINGFYSAETNVGLVREVLELPPVFKPEPSDPKYLELRIMQNLAGYVAQYLYPANKADSYYLSEMLYEELTGGGDDDENSDYTKVLKDLESLMLFDNSQDDFQSYYENFLIEQCRHILRQPPIWKAVKAIAETLLDKSEMTGEEIYDACYQIDGFEPIVDRLRDIYLKELYLG